MLSSRYPSKANTAVSLAKSTWIVSLWLADVVDDLEVVDAVVAPDMPDSSAFFIFMATSNLVSSYSR